jgi:anion-transporting  ArsA/GET3 family ATPase
MDAVSFCRQSSVILVVGKGGVGKTTLTATLGLLASHLGLEVLMVELEGRASASGLLGHPLALSYEEEVVLPRRGDAGAIRARSLRPDHVLLDYLASHGLSKVSRRLRSTGALDVVATAVPGLKDILVLGKVKQLERAGVADLILVDAPASGHAVSFLTSASGLADAAQGGPIRSQSEDVLELLHDPSRCQVLLVTVPEETPVQETVETAYTLEDRIGVALGPVIVNCCDLIGEGLEEDPAAIEAKWPGKLSEPERQSLGSAALWRHRRRLAQRAQLDRMAEALPLAQLRLPFLPGELHSREEIEPLVAALAEAIADLPEP